MKHITKICICLLCVLNVFLYSSVSHAAPSYSVVVPSSGSAVLIESQIESSEITGENFRTATYEYNVDLTFRFTGVEDGYLNGYYNFEISYDQVSPGTWQRAASNVFADPYIGMQDTYRVFVVNQSSSTSINVFIYLNNYPCFEGSTHNLQLGTFTWRYAMYNNSATQNDVNSRLAVSSRFVAGSSSFTFNANPVTGQGYTAIYKQAITDALIDGKLDLVYDYLILWKSTQDGYLADIELSVDDIETWLSYINTVQVSQDNKLELIRQLLFTFPSYSSQMLNYMQQILSMNASQAAQAASNAAAQATQEQKASDALEAANDFAKPNIGAMNIDPLDYVDSDGFSGVSLIIGTVLNVPTIVTMLLIATTCAFIGYALYGKK